MGKPLPAKDKRIAVALLRKILDEETVEEKERETVKNLLVKRLKRYGWTYEEFLSHQLKYGATEEKISELFNKFEEARQRRRDDRMAREAQKAPALTENEREALRMLGEKAREEFRKLGRAAIKALFHTA